MEANKILSADILDLVFEGRNKDYGAYELRKTYNRRITKALIITASVALLALLGSFLANKIASSGPKIKKQEVNLADIKQEEEKKVEPPPPPPPPPKPIVEMKQFTPPIIKKDEEVKEEEKPPEQEELKDVKIDVSNQEGVKDEAPTVVNIDEGKQVVEEKKEEDENKIFEKVEIEAFYQGGPAAWKKYLEKELRAEVPTDAGAPPGVYRVEIRFVVDKEGRISEAKPLTSHGFGMEEEAIRVIKKAKWTPGFQNGKYVSSYHVQPISFQITEDQ
jgi:protein TonB